MSDKSSIEWTVAVVTPRADLRAAGHRVPRRVAETFAERFRGTEGHYFAGGFDVQLRPDKLDQPLRWKKPRRVFVNSMSDLFHEAIPDEFIVEVFARMWWAPEHTFQVLTKRHGRMRSLLPRIEEPLRQREHDLGLMDYPTPLKWPLPNVWLGVSVEDQKWADIRVPALLDTPAAVRWLSCEPLLSAVDLSRWLDPETTGRFLGPDASDPGLYWQPGNTVDWVVAGGESGRGARPMHPDWARTLRDQCAAASVPFFFKQWGNWAPLAPVDAKPGDSIVTDTGEVHQIPSDRFDGFSVELRRRSYAVRRDGKKAAGRVLDGRTWDEYPDSLLERET